MDGGVDGAVNGNADGRLVGKEDGLPIGKDDGRRDEDIDGKGVNDGTNVGVEDGKFVGKDVKCSVGLTLCNVEGTIDLLSVGSNVGYKEGPSLDTKLGEILKSIDGDPDRMFEG